MTRKSRKKKWDGLCPMGKHGLDYEGQECRPCLEGEFARKIVLAADEVSRSIWETGLSGRTIRAFQRMEEALNRYFGRKR